MEKWMVFVVLGVLVLMYAFLIIRQKRQAKKNEEIVNSFKVGDKVITHIGIYGKIKRIYNTTYGKVCVLEIGTLNKIDVEMDMRYIAGLDEKTAVAEEPKKEEPVPVEVKEEIKEERVVEKTQKTKNKSSKENK